MSQRNVERVIGHLVTDEEFRRRFAIDPARSLADLVASGVELNGVEMTALATIDLDRAAEFADAIDPRIQKASGQGAIS